MERVIVFPEPQELQLFDGEVRVASRGGAATYWIQDDPDSPLSAEALRVLRAALRKLGAGLKPAKNLSKADLIFVYTDDLADVEEYEIDAINRKVLIYAASDHAAVHAAHTLRQVLRRQGPNVVVPRFYVSDWPDLRYRGIFQESTFSSAAMTLDDWKGVVDEHAALKLNTLMVCLYSSWARKDHTKDFMYFPSSKHPKLVTPEPEEYYSPARKSHVKRNILPLIYKEDFFGEIVKYGQERGVLVAPYFNCLGHNALIPRVYPDIAMVDEKGNPQPEGFCTSNPKTYKVLFDLLDEVIERYAKPYGVDVFGIGYDEVRWACHCPKCRRLPKTAADNFILRHLVRVLRHLKKRGMTRVVLWHDMIDRTGLLNKNLVEILKREKLEDIPALAWWHYAPFDVQLPLYPNRGRLPLSYRPQFGLANWGAASAGWNYMMPWPLSQVGKPGSIVSHAQIAARDGAEGMTSYSSYDTIFTQGMHALSDYSWNLRAHTDLRRFEDKFAHRLFGGDWEQGARLLRRMEEGIDPWGGHFENVYSRTVKQGDPGTAMFKLPKSAFYESNFQATITTYKEIADGLRQLAAKSTDPKFVRAVAADADYFGATIEATLGTLLNVRTYVDARFDPTNEALVQRFADQIKAYERCIKTFEKAMASVERCRYKPSVPSVLNRMTIMRDFMHRHHARCLKLIPQLRKGDDGVLPTFDYPLDVYHFDYLGLKLF
jgi:hypothetical protein